MIAAIARSRPTVKRRDMDAVLSCLVSGEIGPGELSVSLVKQLSAYLGTSGGFAVREYLRAVEFALEGLELETGSSVLLSPLTPAVYGHALRRRGIGMVFVDVDPDTGCVDPIAARSLLDKKPAALVSYSPLGFAPPIDGIAELDVPVLEDVSTCLGANTGERRTGSLGKFVVVGLEADHMITAGGGAVVLSQSTRDLGVLRREVGELPVHSLLSNMNAALALTQLKHIEEFISRRGDIAKHYLNALLKSRHRTMTQDGDGENVYYSFPVVLNGSVKDAVKYAKSKGVETSTAFQDSLIHHCEDATQSCPAAAALSLRCLLFPLYPMLGRHDVERVTKVLSTLP